MEQKREKVNTVVDSAIENILKHIKKLEADKSVSDREIVEDIKILLKDLKAKNEITWYEGVTTRRGSFNEKGSV